MTSEVLNRLQTQCMDAVFHILGFLSDEQLVRMQCCSKQWCEIVRHVECWADRQPIQLPLHLDGRHESLNRLPFQKARLCWPHPAYDLLWFLRHHPTCSEIANVLSHQIVFNNFDTFKNFVAKSDKTIRFIEPMDTQCTHWLLSHDFDRFINSLTIDFHTSPSTASLFDTALFDTALAPPPLILDEFPNRFAAVRSLYLKTFLVTEDLMLKIKNDLPNLEYLQLDISNDLTASLAPLAELQHLQKVAFSWFTLHNLRQTTALRSLTALDLRFRPINETGPELLTELIKFPRLHTLCFRLETNEWMNHPIASQLTVKRVAIEVRDGHTKSLRLDRMQCAWPSVTWLQTTYVGRNLCVSIPVPGAKLAKLFPNLQHLSLCSANFLSNPYINPSGFCISNLEAFKHLRVLDAPHSKFDASQDFIQHVVVRQPSQDR